MTGTGLTQRLLPVFVAQPGLTSAAALVDVVTDAEWSVHDSGTRDPCESCGLAVWRGLITNRRGAPDRQAWFDGPPAAFSAEHGPARCQRLRQEAP